MNKDINKSSFLLSDSSFNVILLKKLSKSLISSKVKSISSNDFLQTLGLPTTSLYKYLSAIDPISSTTSST